MIYASVSIVALSFCNSAQTVADVRILVHVRYLEILDSGT